MQKCEEQPLPSLLCSDPWAGASRGAKGPLCSLWLPSCHVQGKGPVLLAKTLFSQALQSRSTTEEPSLIVLPGAGGHYPSRHTEDRTGDLQCCECKSQPFLRPSSQSSRQGCWPGGARLGAKGTRPAGLQMLHGIPRCDQNHAPHHA